MPKDTFLNLDEAKQKRIFEAAVENSPKGASGSVHNQVVKTRVSRGAFTRI